MEFLSHIILQCLRLHFLLKYLVLPGHEIHLLPSLIEPSLQESILHSSFPHFLTEYEPLRNELLHLLQVSQVCDVRAFNLEVSISEMDLVLQQLRSCFNPRAGTQIVGDEMVKISAKIDREANVRKDTVQIIDTNISNSNPYYEAITESAVATLYNPLCSKLKLPLDKYESWKDLKITIDYSWIKN